MTALELRRAQEIIDDMVRSFPTKEGLEPILDGIADEEAYLNSPLKVAWVLKEPYDYFDENNQPAGGGWSLVKEAFYLENSWKNPTWQKIAYVMHGFHHEKHWNEIEWIRDNPSIIDEIKAVAWINVSKLPGYTSSDDKKIRAAYEEWKEILHKQLDTYNPDVIIFGNTFECFKEYYGNPQANTSDPNVYHYKVGNLHLLNAYHPGRKGEKYVNSLIDALLKIRDGKL